MILERGEYRDSGFQIRLWWGYAPDAEEDVGGLWWYDRATEHYVWNRAPE